MNNPYSITTVFKGNESNPYEEGFKTIETAQAAFDRFVREAKMFPDDKLIEVELVDLTGEEATTLNRWNRE